MSDDSGPAPSGQESLSAVGRRLTKESSMLFARSVLLKGITIVASIALARILGAEALGLWAIVTATAGVAWVVAEMGLGTASVTVIGQTSNEAGVRSVETSAICLALLLGGGIIAVFAFLTPLLATKLYAVPDAFPLFLLSAATMIVSLGPNIFGSFLQAERRISALALVGLGVGVLNAVCLVAGAVLFGLLGAFAASLIVAVISWGIHQSLLTRRVRRRWRLSSFSRLQSRRLMSLGFPLVVSGLITTLGTWVALTLMELTGRFDSIGHYNVAWRAAAFLSFPSSAIFVALFPLAAQTFHANQPLFRRTLRQTMRYTLVAMVPISASFALLAPEVVLILYGPGYAPAQSLLAVLVAGGFLTSLAPWASMLFYVSNNMLKGAMMYCAVVVMQMLTAAFLIPTIGVLGLVASTLVLSFGITVLSPLFLRGLPSEPDVRWANLRALLAAGALLGISLLSLTLGFQLRVLVLSAVIISYVLYLRVFVLTPNDRQFLRGLLSSAVRKLRLSR